jgi:hypothetical protein
MAKKLKKTAFFALWKKVKIKLGEKPGKNWGKMSLSPQE